MQVLSARRHRPAPSYLASLSRAKLSRYCESIKYSFFLLELMTLTFGRRRGGDIWRGSTRKSASLFHSLSDGLRATRVTTILRCARCIKAGDVHNVCSADGTGRIREQTLCFGGAAGRRTLLRMYITPRCLYGKLLQINSMITIPSPWMFPTMFAPLVT